MPQVLGVAASPSGVAQAASEAAAGVGLQECRLEWVVWDAATQALVASSNSSENSATSAGLAPTLVIGAPARFVESGPHLAVVGEVSGGGARQWALGVSVAREEVLWHVSHYVAMLLSVAVLVVFAACLSRGFFRSGGGAHRLSLECTHRPAPAANPATPVHSFAPRRRQPAV